MKTANLMLGFGIGFYYSVGVNASLFWGMLYYSVIVGYMLCAIFKDKMTGIDKVFGATICSVIWIVFLTKAIVYQSCPEVFNWTRFYIGIAFVFLSMIYLLHCVKVKTRYHV